MIELDKELVTQWTQPKENQARMPIYIKVNCPSCGTSLVGFKIGFSQLYNDEIFHARAHCMACGTPAHLFMVNWMPKNDPDSRNARLYIDPSPMIDLGLSKDIDFQAISPRFVTIYEQAIRAAQMGYDELVGMGYRKALEFLIKDYLIGKKSIDKVAVQKAMLMQCIENYVDDPRIKKAARHAAWLGNDETHYERRNPTGDLNDLKRLMGLTLHWISMETLTEGLDD